MNTKEKIEMGFVVTFTIIIWGLIALGCIALFKSNNTTYKTNPKQQYIDSLIEVNKTKDVQIGYALAEAQTQSDRAVKAELAAKQRDTVYLTRVKYIRQLAPDTCQPYLEAMGKECDTLIMAHVNNEMAKDTLLAKKEAVIELYAAKDSTSQLVIGDQVKQINKLTRKAKAVRFFNKVLVGAAVAATGVVMWLTVVK